MIHGARGSYTGNTAGVERLRVPPLHLNDGRQGFRNQCEAGVEVRLVWSPLIVAQSRMVPAQHGRVHCGLFLLLVTCYGPAVSYLCRVRLLAHSCHCVSKTKFEIAPTFHVIK